MAAACFGTNRLLVGFTLLGNQLEINKTLILLSVIITEIHGFSKIENIMDKATNIY